MGLAAVWLLLLGRSSFSALGLISVDVTMKKISNKNTISVMDDMLKAALTLFLVFRAIFSYLIGSFNRSINSVVVASILKTTFSTLATRMLYAKYAMIPTVRPATVVTMAV